MLADQYYDFEMFVGWAFSHMSIMHATDLMTRQIQLKEQQSYCLQRYLGSVLKMLLINGLCRALLHVVAALVHAWQS